jgi:methionine synthase II (cobalamin-independent)
LGRWYKSGVKIALVINQDYVDAIDALRAFAREETKELKSSVMRFLQIDEWSRKNLKKIRRRVG